MRRGKPAAILDRAHDSDFRIVARYQAEFRGIAEYYQLAYNRHRLGSLRYVMERSMTKTLGHKNKLSVSKVWNRYRATWQTAAGPRRGLQVTVERGAGKKPLVARWGGISLARRTTRVVLKDELPGIWRKRPAELVERLDVRPLRALHDADGRRSAPRSAPERPPPRRIGPHSPNGSGRWHHAAARP